MENKEEKHLDIPLHPVKSSQIAKIGYDPETNTAAIQFHGRAGSEGSVYHYPGTTQKEFDALKNAKSVGTAFGQGLKTRTNFKKIPPKKAH